MRNGRGFNHSPRPASRCLALLQLRPVTAVQNHARHRAGRRPMAVLAKRANEQRLGVVMTLLVRSQPRPRLGIASAVAAGKRANEQRRMFGKIDALLVRGSQGKELLAARVAGKASERTKPRSSDDIARSVDGLGVVPAGRGVPCERTNKGRASEAGVCSVARRQRSHLS